jgi:hypothetical protein
LQKKTWWQLASRSCWNRALRLTCFLSASITRKDLQFGTWTDPSFQRHYQFRPTTSGMCQAKDLSAPPHITIVVKNIYCYIPNNVIQNILSSFII